MIHQLVKIANTLDARGHYDLANQITELVKTAASPSDLTRALKNDDRKGAHRALTNFISKVPYGSTPQQELGMTDDEYRDFVNYIRIGELRQARSMFGIGEKEEELTFAEMFEKDLKQQRQPTIKKYELTNQTINHGGVPLYRVKRLADGVRGGYIGDESNLSQNGNCFVHGEAKVYGSARVYENAQIFDKAVVTHYAKVYGQATVGGNARILERAEVFGKTYVV